MIIVFWVYLNVKLENHVLVFTHEGGSWVCLS